MVVTTDTCPGREIADYVETIILDTTVNRRSNNDVGDAMAKLVTDIAVKASKMGAHAVVGLTYTVTNVNDYWFIIVMIGTVVTLHPRVAIDNEVKK